MKFKLALPFLLLLFSSPFAKAEDYPSFLDLHGGASMPLGGADSDYKPGLHFGGSVLNRAGKWTAVGARASVYTMNARMEEWSPNELSLTSFELSAVVRLISEFQKGFAGFFQFGIGGFNTRYENAAGSDAGIEMSRDLGFTPGVGIVFRKLLLSTNVYIIDINGDFGIRWAALSVGINF